jgi:hypothetical protein
LANPVMVCFFGAVGVLSPDSDILQV